MKKILILLIVIAFIATMLFIGCKATTAAASTVAETTLAETNAAVGTTADISKFKGQKLVVRMTPDDALKNGKPKSEEFAKLYGINLDYNEIAWSIYTNQGPQILAEDQPVDVMITTVNFWTQWPDKITILNDLYPKDLWNKMDPFLAEDFPCKIKGNIYAIPFTPSYCFMFYNKELFSAAGITNVPETWAELKDDLKKLVAINSNYKLVLPFAPEWAYNQMLIFMKAAGQPILSVKNGELSWYYNTPQAEETLQFLVDLFNEGLMPKDVLTQKNSDTVSLFNNGSISMMQSWDQLIYSMDPAVKAKTGYFITPGLKKGLGPGICGSEYLSIPKAAQNVPLAVEYLKYMTSPENSKARTKEGLTPLYTDQYNDPEITAILPQLDIIKEAEASNQMVSTLWLPPIANNYENADNMGKIIISTCLGQLSVQDALTQLQDYAVKNCKLLPIYEGANLQ